MQRERSLQRETKTGGVTLGRILLVGPRSEAAVDRAVSVEQ